MWEKAPVSPRMYLHSGVKKPGNKNTCTGLTNQGPINPMPVLVWITFSIVQGEGRIWWHFGVTTLFNGDHQICNWIDTHSLVPRPSYRPVFDHLQYAKWRGRTGPVYHVSVYLGRGRGEGGDPLKEWARGLILSVCPKCWSFELLQSEKCTALRSKWRMRALNASF